MPRKELGGLIDTYYDINLEAILVIRTSGSLWDILENNNLCTHGLLPRVGLKGTTLVKFHVIKKIIKKFYFTQITAKR